MKQTYREAIQKLQLDSNTLYEKCGALRDAATLDEKEYWNKLRGQLSKVWDVFRDLDNSITDDRGATELNGTY